MELEYVLLDPTGNITALVQTPAPPQRQPELALALMAAEPAAEQVGFLSPGGADSEISLRMAGGEFCGNATMCAAVQYCAAAAPAGGTVRVRASGMLEPVTVAAVPLPDGSWRCRELLPRRPSLETVTLRLGAETLRAPLLRFDAIAHLILPRDAERAEVERAAPEWCAALGAEALGCMLLDEAACRLTPLVWVPGAKTLFWERSCASGSAAVGAYLAQKTCGNVAVTLAQPGGDLRVEAAPVGKILLSGTVRTLKVGKILSDQQDFA